MVPEKNRTCPKCGEVLYSDDTVCPSCGYSLKKKRQKTILYYILAFFLLSCLLNSNFYHSLRFRYYANQPKERLNLSSGSEDMETARQQLHDFRAQYHTSRQMEYNYLAYKYHPEDVEEILRQNVIDYDAQARLRAQDFADEGGYSKEGIRKNLTYCFFTNEQAQMASDSLQIDWGEQAKISALKHEKRGPHSYSILVRFVMGEDFSRAEADAGIEKMVFESGKGEKYWKENAYLDALEEKQEHPDMREEDIRTYLYDSGYKRKEINYAVVKLAG